MYIFNCKPHLIHCLFQLTSCPFKYFVEIYFEAISDQSFCHVFQILLHSTSVSINTIGHLFIYIPAGQFVTFGLIVVQIQVSFPNIFPSWCHSSDMHSYIALYHVVAMNIIDLHIRRSACCYNNFPFPSFTTPLCPHCRSATKRK